MATAASIYDELAQTAENHMRAVLPKTPGSNDVDSAAILSNLASNYRQDWGHSYFISTRPPLQGERDGQGFVDHMSGMAPMLETWSIDVTNTCVDTEKRSVTVRADFHMKPKNGDEVLNDIIFWMNMDETGRKLIKVTEFVDPIASAELGARMKAGMSK